MSGGTQLRGNIGQSGRESELKMSKPSSVLMTLPGSNEPEALLSRALAGDEGAFAALFNSQRDRLRRLVRLRLDRRLSGRIDTDDVLQDIYLEARRRLADYARDPQAMPFHLWLRLVTGQKLTDLHRFHLGAQLRDAGIEVSHHRGALPQATSVSLAAQLLGKITSASRAAIRAEHQLILQEALNGMDPIDREVLTL
jgi:RNA polymerase sigma-70 factor (ECF subfamily)